MARTFWGNMLELLAGAGLNTASRIGSGLILNPIEEASRERLMNKQALLESYLPQVGPGEQGRAAGEFVGSLTGKQLPMAPQTTGVGEITSPIGAKLTSPDLSQLPEGYKAPTAFIPTATSTDRLRAKVIQGMPLESQRKALAPIDLTAREKMEIIDAGHIAKLAQDKELAREKMVQQMSIAQMMDETRRQQHTMMAPFYQARIEQMKDEAQRKSAQMEYTDLQKLISSVNAAKDKTTQQDLKAQVNEFLKGSQYHKDLYPMFFEPEVTRWFAPNIPAKPVTKQGTDVGVKSTGVQSSFYRVVQNRQTGEKRIFTSEEEYNKFMGK
jgi:hypothetical protein